MKEKISILIIEDNPVVIDSYRNALKKVFSGDHKLVVDTAYNCDSALKSLIAAAKAKPYDILLIDIRLPPSVDGTITSGEDLAFRAKHWLPNAKIVIITSFSEHDRIQRIIKQTNPDGLLIKGDITSDGFAIAIQAIVNNETYYSTTVNS